MARPEVVRQRARPEDQERIVGMTCHATMIAPSPGAVSGCVSERIVFALYDRR